MFFFPHSALEEEFCQFSSSKAEVKLNGGIFKNALQCSKYKEEEMKSELQYGSQSSIEKLVRLYTYLTSSTIYGFHISG